MSLVEREDRGKAGFGGGTAAAEPVASSGSTGVVRVKGKDWAVGLFWNSVEEIPQAAAEAKAMAAREGTSGDFYCLRISGSPQYGLGSRSVGHRAGMPSLAATLADNRPGSWLGCFAVEEGWYVIAVRDDGIFPGTDQFFSSEDDARAAFDQGYAVGGWQDKFAPASFGFEDSKDLPINGLLIGKPSVRLIDVAGRSKVFYLIGALVAVGALIFIGFEYTEYLKRMSIEASLDIMRRTGMSNPLVQKVDVPPMPWEGRPQGAALIEACISGIETLQKVEFAGWKIVNYACDGEKRAAALDLQRDGPVSSINWVKYAVDKAGLRSGVSPAGNDRAQVTQPLGSVDTIKIDVKTGKIADFQRYLISQFDERLTRIDLGAGERTQFFAALKFSFRTQISPLRYVEILRRVPALVVSKVTYDPNSWNWTVEGLAYEQLPLPKNAKPRR